MNLHIFNPEHDIALASNLSNFTAPHAGRQLRHDLGFLPEVWAEEGDCILVDDVELAQYEGKKFLQAMARQLGRSLHHPSYKFIPSKPSACIQQTTSVFLHQPLLRYFKTKIAALHSKTQAANV